MCHVVRLHTAREDSSLIADCSTLPAPILGRVLEVIELSRKPKRWVRALDALRQDYHLPGLAVWFAGHGGSPPLPGPIRDPFEPLPLFGNNTHLLESLVDGQGVLPQGASRWLKACARRRWPLIVLWALACLYWSVRSAQGLWHALQAGHFPSVDMSVVAGLLAVGLLYVLVTRDWLLIPQGVLTRRRIGLPTHLLERFTRTDSTLLIVLQDPTWTAYVCRAGSVRSQELKDAECLAFLAAWQSSAPVPELAQLIDYA